MAITWQVVERGFIRFLTLFLPASVGIAIERRFRGYQESCNLKLSHVAFVSFGSSGRTWLRVLLSKALALQHDLNTDAIIDLDNLHRLCPGIPIAFFTHDNYLRDYTGSGPSKIAFRRKPVLLLVRHPADVAVSQYFQWKHRMRWRKKIINNYPLQANLSLFDFAMHRECGLPKIIRFMNEWAADITTIPKLALVRYEDLRSDTEPELTRVLNFIGVQIDRENLRKAV